jgi:hypothetical protein
METVMENNELDVRPGGLSSAAPMEPSVPLSPPEASIPDAVTIVVRRTGTYELTDTLVRALGSAIEATAFEEQAGREWALAAAAVPDTLDYPHDGASDGAWKRWEVRRERAWKRFREMLTCDPDAAPTGAWQSPEEPSYHHIIVPFAASAIEAGTAETAQAAVHDSAGPQDDARKDPS